MISAITADQWQRFERDGFVDLGKLLSDEDTAALRSRADDLALGNIKNPEVRMQMDTGGEYTALPDAVESFPVATLQYRKIQGLEADDLFAAVLAHPLIAQVAARHYGPHAPVSIFRAMIMNKPAELGTSLPWHQDGGAVWALDRDPLVTVWIALDPATFDNGCMHVVRGSHRLGLLSTFGSTLTDADVQAHCREQDVHVLEVAEGHVVLLHNWLIHSSGVNHSAAPRRAFTTCLMHGATRNTLTGDHFPMLIGDPPAPHRYVDQMQIDTAAHRESAAQSEAYAISLLAENRRLQDEIRRLTESA